MNGAIGCFALVLPLFAVIACDGARTTSGVPPGPYIPRKNIPCAPQGSKCECDVTTSCDPSCEACDPECPCTMVDVPDAGADLDALSPDASGARDAATSADAAYVGERSECTRMCALIYGLCRFRFGSLDEGACTESCVAGAFGGAEYCLLRIQPDLRCPQNARCFLGDVNTCMGTRNSCVSQCDSMNRSCNGSNNMTCIDLNICDPTCGFACGDRVNTCYQACL